MRVLLVGNYLPDKQESMQRYAEMVRRELTQCGIEVELIRPREFFGKLRSAGYGVGKWLGYIDKFVIFPHHLRRVALRIPGRVVHVCDHSNAMYTSVLQDLPHLVTCHDVLAIRSALGDYPQNRTKWAGRRLQAWIRNGLSRAERVLCDSDATRAELVKLEPSLRTKTVTIYPALNYHYGPMTSLAAQAQLRNAVPGWGLKRGEYLFHVGANQWYKNREGLLRIYFAYIDRGGALPLVMAGKPLTAALRQLVKEAPSGARVIAIENVDNATLNALYADAAALIFPSLYEGFGWPILEALAVGCRVVCSRRASLPEVGGEAAIYIDPDDTAATAKSIILALTQPVEEVSHRQELGFKQVARFAATGTRLIIANYELVLNEQNLCQRDGSIL